MRAGEGYAKRRGEERGAEWKEGGKREERGRNTGHSQKRHSHPQTKTLVRNNQLYQKNEQRGEKNKNKKKKKKKSNEQERGSAYLSAPVV